MRWITALNLAHWADTLQARPNFPGLVADLIRATAVTVSDVRFPRGDKGQVRGFDGVLEAVGMPPYVPEGRSIWEFGVNSGAAAKAGADYLTRTGQVDEAVRRETTFVFVSPRTWDNPKEKLQDWVEAKRQLGEWRDVRYIDGSMLEDWLATCPAVAARWARYELGLLPALGVRSIDEFWDEYSNRFSPALVEDVLLAGRDTQSSELVEALRERGGRLAYAADTPDEVLAFAISAIRRAEPEVRYFIEARSLVVESEDAARQLVGKAGLIFLPRAQARKLAGSFLPYGPTVVSAGADEQRSNHTLLKRPDSSALGRAFVAMGLTEREGYDLARRCGRSLAVLARQRPSGTAETPEWVATGADALLPALLAGAWVSSSESDQKILCTLATHNDYESLEAPLRRLARFRDPPVDHVGDVWALRSSVDAFVYLGHLLGPEHLRRFRHAAQEVFSQLRPEPKADEVYNPVSVRKDAHSAWLREGMMTMLLHMAVLHEQAGFTVVGSTPQEFVNDLVRGLTGLASDHRLLASLQDNLALLAEAAPIPFLEALEHLLEGDAARIKPIFEEHKGLLTPRTYHVGLLWALETLAWDGRLLLQVALCLARLAEIDPGGTISNRPINSLRAIFLSWAPNTRAPGKERDAVLTHVVNAVPAIAWSLLVKLLPRFHDSSSPSAKPKFREFDEGEREVLTYRVVWESQATVVKLALAHVGQDPERWKTLIDAMGAFPFDAINSTLTALDVVLSSVAADVQYQIWDALRKTANRHRSFQNADWALRGEVLSLVDAVVQKFTPEDPLAQSAWLFDDWMPDYPTMVEAVGDPMAPIEDARSAAIRTILEAKGLVGLIEIAQRAKVPATVAAATQSLQLSRGQLVDLLRLAMERGEHFNSLCAVALAQGVSRFGTEFAHDFRNIVRTLTVTPSRTARLLTALDENLQSWTIVESFGQEINKAYWTEKRAFYVTGDTEELLFAVEQYATHGRPMAAIETAIRRLNELASDMLLRLLDGAVSEINNSTTQHGTMTAYYLEQVFDELEGRSDIPPMEHARREFAYLPFFHSRKKPLILHRLMTEQPTLFMEAVCAVFRSDHAEHSDVTEVEERRARAAYDLLEGIHILPGQVGNEVDVNILVQWCSEVRLLARNSGRVDVTDFRIGHMFAHSPASQLDHAWPHEAVRKAIEDIASEKLENGLMVERYNMRGVFSKAIGEGGNQERALAKQASDWARIMADAPRTAAMLRRVADGWMRDAEQEDIRAAKQALRD